mgnify:CR=1 FL=1
MLLGISLPWYFLAELRSPGFIDYFIIGEHFERYFNSEWEGDKLFKKTKYAKPLIELDKK